MPRRTGDETRRLLIETGIALLHERGATAGVSHIRLQDVLKRAGLTTGAAYRLWPDQEHFHRELAVAATRWRDDVPITRTIAAIQDLVETRAPLFEVIRAATAAHVDGFGVIGTEDRLRSARS
jgi:AcrR family transcriptional regulator